MKKSHDVIVAARLIQTFESAKKRGKDFNLTYEYLENVMSQKVCAYSGEEFGTSDDDIMSLERFDNDIGYMIGNVIPVKRKYNTMRKDYTLDELIKIRKELASRIVNGSDSKSIGKLALTQEKWERIKFLAKELHNSKIKLNNRKKHLKQFDKATKTPEIEATIISLKARIAGGQNNIGKRQAALNALLNGAEWKVKSKASNAEMLFNDYGKIITGLTRFENLSRLDKMKINKGLPLNASIFKLI